MDNSAQSARAWYERNYTEEGLGAQRLYPNEELLRFLGMNFFCRIPKPERRRIRVLEIGCGSCPNLWMVAKEGFDAYGIDHSTQSIRLGRQVLAHWNVGANLQVGSMMALPYRSGVFDIVYDIFSAYCLCEKDFQICLDEVRRVLVRGGIFFSYTPSANSDAFINYAPAKKLDDWTLDGIKRKTSIFVGNDYPFRFASTEQYRELLETRDFEIIHLERVSRTYKRMQEYFEFLTVGGRKR